MFLKILNCHDLNFILSCNELLKSGLFYMTNQQTIQCAASLWQHLRLGVAICSVSVYALREAPHCGLLTDKQ